MRMAEKKDDEMLQFVTIIKEHGMPLLSKSKKPQDKIAKENAAAAVMNVYGCKGVEMTKDQIRKKISNIEQKIKQQLDMKKTGGGPPPVLKEFQKIWLDMISECRDEPNPKMHKLSFGISVGTSGTSHPSDSKAPPSVEDSIDMNQSACGTSVGTSKHTESRTPSPAISDDPIPSTSSGNQQMKTPISRNSQKRSRDALNRCFVVETDETEVLSTSQLQRLVLLEQLHYLREKRSKIWSTPASNKPIESASGLGDMSELETAPESRFVIDPMTGNEYVKL